MSATEVLSGPETEPVPALDVERPAEGVRSSSVGPDLSPVALPVQAPQRSIEDVLLCVRVMEEDIDLGTPREGQQCAVARAARRQLVLAGYEPSYLCVRPHSATVCVGPSQLTLEHSASSFIHSFDSGLPVEPCWVNFTRRREG